MRVAMIGAGYVGLVSAACFSEFGFTVACVGSILGKALAVLGVTFKPNTSDVRESPSLTILPALMEPGEGERPPSDAGSRAARPTRR